MDKGVDQIITRIAQDIAKLKSGNLSVSELTELTELSRDLYEILLITRYQKLNNHSEKTDHSTENITQVIADKVTESKEEEIIEETTSDDLLFDFSGTSETTENKPEMPLFDLETADSTAEKANTKITENQIVSEEKAPEIESSLNTNYEDKFSNSIANRMQLSPISNLSGHISLNQRFSFIANLFNNNADIYNNTVASIDKMTTNVEAKERLHTLQQEYNWDLENKEVIEFITLVERRFV